MDWEASWIGRAWIGKGRGWEAARTGGGERRGLGRVVDDEESWIGKSRGWGASWIGGRGLGKVAAGKPLLLEKLRTSCYNVGRFCAK